MATINKNASNMDFPLQIARQYAAPIDTKEVFYSLSDAQDYATSYATAYVGQQIVVVDETAGTATAYVIQNEDGDLEQVGKDVDLTNYVTLTSAQTISGTKTFSNGVTIKGNITNSSGKAITLPTSAGTLALVSEIPTNVSELTNDSGYATTDYLTGNYYTETEVDNLLSALKKASMQVVSALPTTGEEGIIYLLGTEQPYEMYIYEGSAWIDLGSTSIDLTNYVTTNTSQTITGAKTFNGGIGASTITTQVITGCYESSTLGVDSNIIPITTSTYSLGSSSKFWGNLYLSGNAYVKGNLSDGTNAVSIANIVTVDGEQTITGSKTFDIAPTVGGLFATSTSAQIGSSSKAFSFVYTANIAYGDTVIDVTDIATKTIATSSTAGLVKPVSKASSMTQSVGVDSDGKLYTYPAEASESYTAGTNIEIGGDDGFVISTVMEPVFTEGVTVGMDSAGTATGTVIAPYAKLICGVNQGLPPTLILVDDGGNETSYSTDAITHQGFECVLPSSSGTLALTSDITTYTLPVATSSTLGGVKSTTTGTTANRYYNVQVNSDGTMKVNVPWTDTTTTYTAGTGISISGTTITNSQPLPVYSSSTAGQVLTSNGTSTVPTWQTLSVASSATAGLAKAGTGLTAGTDGTLSLTFATTAEVDALFS